MLLKNVHFCDKCYKSFTVLINSTSVYAYLAIDALRSARDPLLLPRVDRRPAGWSPSIALALLPPGAGRLVMVTLTEKMQSN